MDTNAELRKKEDGTRKEEALPYDGDARIDTHHEPCAQGQDSHCVEKMLVLTVLFVSIGAHRLNDHTDDGMRK